MLCGNAGFWLEGLLLSGMRLAGLDLEQSTLVAALAGITTYIILCPLVLYAPGDSPRNERLQKTLRPLLLTGRRMRSTLMN
jgi:hypothetical protein